MNVLEEIRKEHGEFRSLVLQIEEANDDKKRTLFEDLYAKVKGHHEAEEEVLFPDVKKNSEEEGKEVVREMVEEHSLIIYQLSLLDRTSLENETWDAKFSVLKEVLTHHLDEEEKELFKQAREVLTKEELEEKYEPFESVMEEYKKIQEKKLTSN